MKANKPLHWKIQWKHIAPMMSDLYAHNARTELLPWAEQNWPLLAQAGMDCAASDLNQTDSIVRAISLSHLHFIFEHLCWQEKFQPNYVRPLGPYLDPAKVAALATDRYVDESKMPAHAFDCLDCLLMSVVPVQSHQNLSVLKGHYGSTEDIGDSMLKYSAFRPDDMSAENMAGLCAAYDFLESADRG